MTDDLQAVIERVRKMPQQRPGKSEQTVGTPRDFLDAVTERFGAPEIDLAAVESVAVCDEFISPEADSLSVEWNNLPAQHLWLNPPYGKIAPWAEKCAGYTGPGNIYFLVPASVGSNWFAEHVDGHARVLFLSPRLKFVGHTRSYPKDLILAVFGRGAEPGYECWRWKR